MKIRVEGVSKRYVTGTGEVAVLDQVTLNVREGECLGLVGPSGCGKTTLLNIIAGFTLPSSGAVYVDGNAVRGPGADRGVIFQQYAVFPWLTVKENIGFGLTLRANFRPRWEREEIVRRYIGLMGLRGFEEAYPKELSGGMKQRVALARAYAVNPAILLMDEPFAALDAQTREDMQELLLEIFMQETKTIVFVTHSVEEAIFLCGRISVLTRRPARVARVIEIPFEYPRSRRLRTALEFVRLREEIEDLIRDEHSKSEKGGVKDAAAARTDLRDVGSVYVGDVGVGSGRSAGAG